MREEESEVLILTSWLCVDQRCDNFVGNCVMSVPVIIIATPGPGGGFGVARVIQTAPVSSGKCAACCVLCRRRAVFCLG
jgi:hypothetical protein